MIYIWLQKRYTNVYKFHLSWTNWIHELVYGSYYIMLSVPCSLEYQHSHAPTLASGATCAVQMCRFTKHMCQVCLKKSQNGDMLIVTMNIDKM
jgi:hypothetical protein